MIEFPTQPFVIFCVFVAGAALAVVAVMVITTRSCVQVLVLARYEARLSRNSVAIFERVMLSLLQSAVAYAFDSATRVRVWGARVRMYVCQSTHAKQSFTCVNK